MRKIYLVGAVGAWLLASACGRLGTGDNLLGDGDGDSLVGDGDGDGDLGDGDVGDGDLGDGDVGDGDVGDGDVGDGDLGGAAGDGDLGGSTGDGGTTGDGDATGGLGGMVIGDGDGDIDPPDNFPPVCVITAPVDGSTTAFHGEPVVPTSQEPSNGQFTGIVFRATATDPEDGELSEDSIKWYIEGSGVSGGSELLGSGAEFVIEALPKGQYKILCQATDSAGDSGEDSVILNVKSPVIYISHPGALDGPRFASEAIEFVAVGYDYEDGMLNSEAFVWESNIDGTLGEGNGAYELSPGVHTVTVKGMDEDQNLASASVLVSTVAVEVLPPVSN